MNLLRLKETYKQVADGKMIIGNLDNKKRGLGKVISELNKENPLRIAYGQLKSYKKTAKDLDMKGDNAKVFVVEKITEYAKSVDSFEVELEIIKGTKIDNPFEGMKEEGLVDKKEHDRRVEFLEGLEAKRASKISNYEYQLEISRDTLKYLTMLNDNTVARNLVDNYYILTGIHYKLLDDGQGQFTLIHEMFLGNKKSLGQSKPVIAIVPKIKDVLRDTDIIFSASDKWTELFISLLAKVNIEKEKYPSFKDYVQETEIEIEGFEKEFRRTKELLVKYYINL